MKNWTKGFLAVFVMAMMLFSMLPATAFGQGTGSSGNGKQEQPTIEKKVNGADSASIGAGESATFTLTSNVPADLWKCFKFSGKAPTTENTGTKIENAKYELTFHDIMDEKLSMNSDSLKVKIGTRELTNNQYTYTVDPDTSGPCKEDHANCTFHITLDLVKLYEDRAIHDVDFKEQTPIVVSYNATLGNDAKAGTYKNKSWVSWDKKIVDRDDPSVDPEGPLDPDDPGTPGESGDDDVDVYTYKILLVKIDKDNNATKLANAKFQLEKKNAEGIWTPVGGEATTDNNGEATWDGLGAGEYRLTETEAPANYIKISKPLEVMLPSEADPITKIATVEFANAGVPETGGNGTMIYTILGLVILGGAAAVFVISRRKSRG